MSESPTSLDSTNLLVLLYKWRKPIIIVCVAAAVVSAAVSLIIPSRFKSTVVLYAEQQHSFGAQLLEDIQKADMLAYGEEEDAERLIQIINSDQVRNKIIDRYKLWEVYEIKKEEQGANTLIGRAYGENVSAKLTKFGSVEVSVLDKDPERAKNMANDIALYADSVANKLSSDRAREAFRYAQASLENLEAEIKMAEDSMSRLRDLGIFNYSNQITALTEQYGVAIAEGHPERAKTIQEQMNFLSKYGTAYNALDNKLDNAYEKLGTLRKRYDLMKIDVESNIPAMRIVDYASAADKKALPVRWLIVAMSTASAFVFVVIFLLLWDNFKRLRADGKL